MYSESESVPEIDKSEDVKLISAIEDAGKTIITFSRKLVTCDKSGDRDITVSLHGLNIVNFLLCKIISEGFYW